MVDVPFDGLGVAIITPFTKDGEKVDKASFRGLINFQIENGVQAIIATGTTGESPTLDHIEHKQVIDLALEYAAGRVPVIAGTGSNNTEEAIGLSRHAEKAGANGLLIVSPYYNKPTQDDLSRHFSDVAHSTQLPVIVYDIVGRCGVLINPNTRIEMLQRAENIVGFKEASGFAHFAESYDAIEHLRNLGKVKQKVGYWSGDDNITHRVVRYAKTKPEVKSGVISVLGNIDPEGTRAYVDAALDLRVSMDTVLDLFFLRTEALSAAMFLETNPKPVKTAAYMMGLIDHPTLRAPLYAMKDANVKKLEETLKQYNLLRTPVASQ